MNEDKVFLKVKPLTNIIHCSTRAIQLMVERGNLEDNAYRYVPGKGRGGKQLEINPMGLPEPYKTQWLRHEDEQKLQLHIDQSPLPEWAVEYASARLDVIRLLQDELKRAKEEGRNITPVYDETADMYNSGHLLEDAYSVLGEVSGVTIRRWLKAYNKARKESADIIDALAPNYHTGKGQRSLPKWYKHRLLKVLLHPNQVNPTRAIKIVNANLRRENKAKPCSIKTAQRWIDDYKEENSDRWVLMREGRKALNDKVLPYLDRDWNLLDVGEVLIADGHVLNFDVKHPQTGKRHRPTLVCFYDGRSRFPVGISIMPTENIDNISEALLDAIRTLGKFPKAVILDNGRAFKAKHFTQSPDLDDAGIGGIYERYGILTHFTLPYHGQSKPIETFFNQLNERFSKMLPTYRGSSIENKVPRLKRNEKEHRKAYDEQVGDWLPTIGEVVQAIKHWSFKTYGTEEHGGLKNGEKPAAVLKAGQGKGVKFSQLIDLMFRAKEVRPRRARFTLEGIVYQNWDVLTGWNKPVLVRYTRNEPGRVWVYDNSGEVPEFMCIAQAYEAVHPLQKLTNDDGEFDPDVRYRLNQRKKLEKRAKRASEDLAEMNRDIADPVGNLLPGPEPEIEQLPDATPNAIDEGLQIDPVEFKVDIDEDGSGDPIFEHAYERFEHIAGKEPNDIDEQDAAFIEEFTKTEIYNDLYRNQHERWVQAVLS